MKRKLWLAGVAVALMLAAPAVGAEKKDKPQKTGEIVDSGSFGAAMPQAFKIASSMLIELAVGELGGGNGAAWDVC